MGLAETEESAETFSKAVNEVRWEVEPQVGEEVGGREEQRDSEESTWVGAVGGIVALEAVRVLWDTGTGRGKTMLSSAVEISSAGRETQDTGLGSSDISSSSLWLSTTLSFLSPAVTTFLASFVFIGIFDPLWIMWVRVGEIPSASLVQDNGLFLSASCFCSVSGLMGLALHILKALAFAFSSAALMKASSPSSLSSSLTGVGDPRWLFDLLLSLVFAFLPCSCFLFALAWARLGICSEALPPFSFPSFEHCS